MANITAWQSALTQAAFAGKIAGGKDRLSLRTGQDLLRDLETKDWGRPMALGAVVVGHRFRTSFFSSVLRRFLPLT